MTHATPSLSAWALGLALLLPASAWSADPTVGATRFSQNCTACHSVASTASTDRGRNAPAMIRNAINTVGAMGGFSFTDAELEDIAAYLGNTPASLSFSATTVGQTSTSQVVTVRASRTAALNSLSASVSGDYVLQGGACGTSLAARGSCTVGVAFAPGAAGSRSGSLNISHSGLTTPVVIALSGSATAAAQATLSLSASSLAFGNQAVGTTSAARNLTVSNTGNAALSFSAISLGGSQASDFSNGGSCAVGTPVAAGGSCSLSVSFAPAGTGSRSASLTLASNASNGNASVALSGTGQAAATPAVTLSASSISFGSVSVGSTSSAQTLTLTNSGGAALNLQTMQVSGPFSFSQTCGNSLAPAASCPISLSFTPAAAGAASGSLQISSDAAGSPHAVALSGTGLLAGTGALQWTGSQTALDFGNVNVGADATLQSLTLNNTGTSPATLSTLALSGAASADFRIDASSTCAAGQSLAAGANCQLAIGFVPSAAGSRAASLVLTSSNASVPDAIALNGNGQVVAAPALSLSANALSFVAANGSSAPAQTLSLSNSGTADLQVSAVSLSNARFTLASPASQGCGTAPFVIAAGASCQLSVSWLGGANDAAEQAELSVSSDLPTATVALSARGEGDTTPASNAGGGGCTLGAGTGAADPTLLLLAAAAGLLAWRRRKGPAARA